MKSTNYNNENNKLQLNKGICTSEQMPWVEYLEIDENTFERKLRIDTPEEIVKKYNEFIQKNTNLENDKIDQKANLQREELLKIRDSFINERNKYELTDISKDVYLYFLEKIELLLRNKSFEKNSRFINRSISNTNWISFDDAINYLFDAIVGNIVILPNDIPYGKSFGDVSIELDKYYKEGKVCEEEKEFLLNIINEVKKYILKNT